ncbi:DNA internalization-related competence protein ComEC/Rec2 [Dokdonella sp.]|uniref:DNA internalization-related competence protein ComEC/Rec2 n=1 Tax=Dokdonella sp. TaxID=2291710 RepID=UPI002631750E|nr:DNA internalization-related competence protein ComEC/Rec2 [Dokdonella sp.]
MGKEPSRHDAGFALLGVASALALLCGALAVHAVPILPPRWLDALLAAAGASALLHPRFRFPGFVLLGFAWCAFRADLALDARLPRDLEGRDFTVVGSVDELPVRREDAVRFGFRVEQAVLDGETIPLHGRLRLSWYGAAPEGLDACSRWRLQLRLKRPRGLINRGGFDSERQALERGIVAVGYVREAASNERLGERGGCVDGLRERLARDIAARVADPHDAALLRAFAIGDTHGLDERDWEIARANGIPHLISISGFHVGVAGLFGALLVRLLWWAWPRLGLRIALPVAQAPAVLATATLYGILAGGSLPTVRTLMMIAVVVLTRCGRRRASGAHSLALALLAMLAFDPLATLSAGFWLSFVGVAFLMLCLTRGERGLVGFLRELSLGQLVMTVSLLPLTVWFFGEASLVGALSNLIAVPLVSFVIVPLCLLGLLALLLWPAAAVVPLAPAAWITHGQWTLLEAMSTWPGAHWYLPEVAPWALAVATLGAAWMFLPRGVPARALGVLLFLPLLVPHRPPPPPGGFVATVVDVGQGLAVLVRTHSHALLYDAGPRYRSGFDLGEAAVLPTLRALGVEVLDRVMVSHGDSDHAGGAAAVARAYPAARIDAGEPARGDVPARQCTAGEAWHWDGVEFRVLGPDAQALATDAKGGNDRSCILLVATAAGRLLLPGDASRRVEPAIAQAVGPGPPLVLLVPHHGSRTSSSVEFVAALEPVLGIVSAGWRSRFGHPHPLVVQRYAAAGVPLEGTAEAGALEIAFARDAAPRLSSRERERRPRYWRE